MRGYIIINHPNIFFINIIYMSDVSTSDNKSFHSYLANNEYVFAVVAILVFAYGQNARLDVPDFMVSLFSNDLFRVLYLALILIIRFDKRPTVAIIMGLLFIYMLKYIEDKKTEEAFNDIMTYKHIVDQHDAQLNMLVDDAHDDAHDDANIQ